MAVAALAAATLLIPLGAAVPASAGDLPPRAIPVVQQGPTTRYDGGEWVSVQIGDVSLGVVWSTNASRAQAGVRFFLDYVRYFGVANLSDEQGSYLRTVPLPLHTVILEQFDRMFEFRDRNADTLFDPRIENRTDGSSDLPVKLLDLHVPWFLDGPVQKDVTNESAWVNFTLSAVDVPYRSVYDPVTHMWRPAERARDGVLDRIGLTFHLHATERDTTAKVPFYDVTLASGNERTPTSSRFAGNETMDVRSVTVDGKYDQTIEGWDFGYADSKLGLLTSFAFGNVYDRPVVQWLQQQFGGACLKDGTFRQCESDAGPTAPVRLSRDMLQVAEGWRPAGQLYWTNNVTVDGQAKTMTFEIYAGGAGTVNRGDRLYTGFRALGAFVYPQGQTIEHDPGLSATSAYAPISETASPTPSLLVALQLAVVGLALVPAVLLRARARRKGGP